MVADRIDGLVHRIFHRIKACESLFKIDATVFHWMRKSYMTNWGKMKEQSGACCWQVAI